MECNQYDMFKTKEEFYSFVDIFKKYILKNELTEVILYSLGCHSISFDGISYGAANPDGDNTKAIRVWLGDNLIIKNYTRDIPEKLGTDLFSLVAFFKNTNKYNAVIFTLNLFNIDVEQVCNNVDIDLSDFEYKEKIYEVKFDEQKVLSLDILKYYKPLKNRKFYNDGISYETQELFNIGYDALTRRITIPIYTENNDLVGVQGRLFCDGKSNKYLYLQSCIKSQILYGLNLSKKFIQEKGEVIVVEGAKAVMQLWSAGIKNVVATLGSKISKHQIQMLCNLDVNVVFCYDEDVLYRKLSKVCENIKQIQSVNVYIMCDMYKKILNKKESPTDNMDKFKKMYKTCKYIV